MRLGAGTSTPKLLASKDSEVYMQDRYAGDVGDFVKLGLLCAFYPGRQLGVTWYRPSPNLQGPFTSASATKSVFAEFYVCN